MRRTTIKREVDLQIISDWIGRGCRILDLGCGRGVFLQYMIDTSDAYGIGVDADFYKIIACVKRGVCAYQGDALSIMQEYPDGYFDWVVCSRTLQELPQPQTVIDEALRVGKRLAIGFVNYGYWRNRWAVMQQGNHVINDVYPEPWFKSKPSNPVSIRDFEIFCQESDIIIHRSVYLRGDWQSLCRILPNLRAGYAVYDLSR